MKITLLGDSIRQQYESRVKELLGNGFEVWTPQENCRFSKYTLRGLFDWANNMEGSDIVHWNNGHWDVCRLFDDGTFSSEEEYVENMMRIVDILQKRYRTVIFATTTPVRTINSYNKNDVIDRFNQLIVPLLQEKGVIINDLNALLRSDVERYISNDTIHLSDEGIELCAGQVASYIREEAQKIPCMSENFGLNNSSKEPQNSTGAPILL